MGAGAEVRSRERTRLRIGVSRYLWETAATTIASATTPSRARKSVSSSFLAMSNGDSSYLLWIVHSRGQLPQRRQLVNHTASAGMAIAHAHDDNRS